MSESQFKQYWIAKIFRAESATAPKVVYSNDMVAELLYQAGFKSAEEVADSELEEILDVEGVSKDKAEALYKSAKEYVAEKQKKEQEAQAAAQAAAAAVSEGQPVEEKQPQES